MTDNTSGGGGETPNPSTTATVTPAQSGATPATTPPALTVEELLKRNADLEHSQNNAKEELERHRKKLSAYEKAENERAAAKQAAEDAERTELERVRKQAEAAQQQIQQYQQELIKSQIKYAAKEKGIQIDTDIIASYLHNKLDKDENGMPTNLDALLDALIKSNPVIAKPAEPATPPAQTAPTPQAPAVPAMNPGRSSIASPGLPTGKPTRLSDLEWSR